MPQRRSKRGPLELNDPVELVIDDALFPANFLPGLVRVEVPPDVPNEAPAEHLIW